MINVVRLVDDAILSLTADFTANPNKYLTEEDLRVHLCFRLMLNFGEIKSTQDGDTSIALHAEFRWFGEYRRKDRSDIVILDVSFLNVTKEVIDRKRQQSVIPRKGFSANKPLAAIELKFRRPDGPSDKEYRNSINADIEKLKQIKNTIGDHSLVCRVVAFDKKSNLNNNLFDEMVTYKFGD